MIGRNVFEKMQTSVQFRPQNRDLAILLGMPKAEKERNDHHALGESDSWRIAADDKFLNLEIGRSDYNWLVTQPDSYLLPTIDINVQDSAVSRAKISNREAISVKSELENTNTCQESASLSDGPLHQHSSSTSIDSSAVANKRPLSFGPGKPTTRATTPTARSTFPAKLKPTRASTPTSRPTLPSSFSKPQLRTSTPTRVITSRSSTPSSRPSRPIVSKPIPRSSTPTRKTGPIISKSLKPTDTLSLSHKRPVSASRGRVNRLSATAAQLTSSGEKPRPQKSCSPPKVRAPNISGGHKTGSKMSLSLRNRGCVKEGEDVNPVLMGTKMVDRVVNMRKLAPPKQDEYVSHDNPIRKSSHENSGFGRSLSKKSLDMAIRHMDIRRSISDKVRPE